MRSFSFHVLVVLSFPLALAAQSRVSAPFQIYGGFTHLTNSFNGVPGSRQPLNGWDAAAAFPAWHGLRFKIDVSGYRGTNLGAKQNTYFIMGGGQYEKFFHHEGVFGQALFGDGGINRYWGAGRIPGNTASFSTILGGGLDTPVSRHFAIRVEGDFQYANFALVKSLSDPAPYEIPGLPNYFGRLSSGVVWYPRVKRARMISGRWGTFLKHSPQSELVFENANSFGHYHIFAYTWWSYLHVAGVEYDRHSWGKFIGAQMDYVAEILPVAILKQPSKTDAFGDPLSTKDKTIAGLGVSPAGLLMMWRADKSWKPYYLIKGGMIAFTQKALSNYASYEDFTLQQSIGVQFRLNHRWDLRTGLSDFHFSNAFMVPNNPGIDEMMYMGALCYHLGKQEE